jgi:hypothetical protein
MVYYGDEGALDSPSLGSGPNGPEDDPYNRAPFPWDDEAGDQNVYGPADAVVRDFYTKLAHMRKQFGSLREGSFETLLTGDTTPSASDDNTYAFARVSGGERAVVALNNGANANTAGVPVAAHFADGTSLVDVLTGATYTVSGGGVALTLAPRTGVVLLPAPAAVDTAAPGASITLSPAANANGWNNTLPVTVNLSAADAGSGVRELRYWVGGGAPTVAAGSAASFQITQPGVYTVYLRAIDNAGNASALASLVVKIDTTAPTVSAVSASPSLLTVANHQMVNVAVSYGASDAASAVTCSLGVTSNEPVSGTGDGDLAPDWFVLDATHLQLRAERAGRTTARVYTITVTCADAADNTTSRSTTVGVPRGR